MKFGKELKASMVQAWRNKYVRYKEIKSKLKELKKLYDEHNVPTNKKQSFADDSDISKIKPNSSITLYGLEHNPSRDEFETVMETLKNSNQREESLQWHIECGEEKYAIRDNTIIDYDEEGSESKESKYNTQNNKTKYRFNNVTSVVEPDLESKMPQFDPQFQDIKFKEKEIAVLLEQDMYKISKFYAQQCKYFGEQHNALCVRVELMCRNLQKRKTQSDEHGETLLHKAKKLASPLISSRSPENGPTTFAFTGGIVNDVGGTESDSNETKQQQKDKLLTTKEIDDEKSYLRLLFRQAYNAIRMLEQYREINEMAFYKITKKHDKNSVLWKNLRSITMKFIKKECNFGNNYFTLFLQKRLEHLYSCHLKPDDQRPSEAIQRLKQPPSDKVIQKESCVIGLCGGWSIAILLVSSVLVATLSDAFWTNWMVYRSWYIFRASIALSIYLWLWGCDLFVFQKYQFNHGFIFGADPTRLLRVPDVWNIAALCSVTTMICTILFVLVFMFVTYNPEIISMICLGCWLLYFVVPFPWLKHTKKFLLKSFGKQLISPFSSVEFIDFFLADQWTSLFNVVVDLFFSFCYLFTGSFLLGNVQATQCDNIETKAWLNLLRLLPYWIRFWQCIRRIIETKKCKSYWHVGNAGKYFFALFVTTIGTFHIYYNNNITKILALIFGIIATLYAYLWDIYKDWGLLRYGENKEYKILRKELTYPAYSYYIAMFVNFLCRIAWAISLFPTSFGIYNPIMMHYLKLPLNVLEIMRRCMWNLFRIENEHLNNCGEFRVVKDIPIAFDYENLIKIDYATNKQPLIPNTNKRASVSLKHGNNNSYNNYNREIVTDEYKNENDHKIEVNSLNNSSSHSADSSANNSSESEVSSLDTLEDHSRYKYIGNNKDSNEKNKIRNKKRLVPKKKKKKMKRKSIKFSIDADNIEFGNVKYKRKNDS